MARDLATLPKGTWLHFSQLPAETTEESFAGFLYECGLDVAPACVSVQPYLKAAAASAIVSFHRDVVATLVNRAIHRKSLNGGLVVARAPHKEAFVQNKSITRC
ncbi:MAG: hypothetical protein WB729_06740 [Candidatus Sulfotelmatobacter sp.]